MVVVGWMQVGFGQSSTYQIIEGSFTWHEAKADAESRGGHLATITNGKEQKTINSLMSTYNKTFFWLGGTDQDSEGNWRWVTGELWDYQNWNQSQPDNDEGNGHFLNIWNNYPNIEQGKWNDWIALKTMGYILELPKVDLDRGLVAYYPFNGNANDESGNGNDGIVNGSTLTSDRNGDDNAAYEFDGLNGYIDTGIKWRR